MGCHRGRHQLAVGVAACALALGVGAFLLRREPPVDGVCLDIDGLASTGSPAGGVGRMDSVEFSRLPIEQEAAVRIGRYRESGARSIECPGYLDLFGNAWGCIAHGDGWVEILIVRDAGDGTSSVQTVRFEAEP